ncbi:hypothetical protein [Sphingomonas sp. LY160]|uniref:hypothetical protein n=1 Tax=Sphingomonas sp. LY160 TaxID=3095342 RepID=UPI002ADEA63E|nr:hypothetical protein [Sphingomonas sp. LY160]MEA1071745.1 hypothetical protein [Sphingomonas sp. LY160]
MSLSGIVPDADIEAKLGQLLSDEGSSRRVYSITDDNDLVVKEGLNAPYAANLKEWQVWSEIVGTAMADTFAECRAVSETGRYLVMERLDTNLGGKAKPATPVWLTDRKRSCLGVSSNGAVKVLDYGQSSDYEGTRSKAPLHSWPSDSDADQMGNITRMLGDNPFGLGNG